MKKSIGCRVLSIILTLVLLVTLIPNVGVKEVKAVTTITSLTISSNDFKLIEGESIKNNSSSGYVSAGCTTTGIKSASIGISADKTDNEDYKAGDVFVKGHVYEIVVILQPKSDYVLGDKISVIASLKDKTDTFEMERYIDSNTPNQSTTFFVYTYKYTMPGKDTDPTKKNISQLGIIDNYNLTNEGEYDYTGSNITGVDIENLYDNTKKLVLNQDYTLEIPEKIKAGSYQLTVNGMGDYTGAFVLPYKIIPASISGAVISTIPNQKYTGSEITPDFTVTLNGKKLSPTTDYTTSYQNNTDIGIATVKITGKGNYKGEKTATFQIYGNVIASYDESTKYANISWTPSNSNSQYFKVFKQTKTDGNWVDVSTSTIYSGSNKTFSYNMGYDSPGEYRFKVLEYKSSAQTSPDATQYSNVVEIEPPKPNLAPTDFNVKPNSSGKFVVYASEPAGLVNAHEMILEASVDGKTWIDVGHFYSFPSSGTDTSISDENKQKLNMKDGATIYFRACFMSLGDSKGPYTDVVTCKYENYTEKRDNQVAAAENVEKEEPVATPGGGYSIDTLTTAGMFKTFEHTMYSLKIEFLGATSSWNYNNSIGKASIKYTFTPKYSGKYNVCFTGLGINDDTEWTGPSGEKVVLGKSSVECTANGTYTCTRKLGDASASTGTGFHTTNLEVGTYNVNIGNGVLVNSTYYNNSFEYCIAPSVMSLDVALNAESDRSSITIKDLNGEGAITLFYKAKSDKNWKSVSTVAASKKKISGLKADTTYQVKMQTVYSAKNSAGNYVKLASPESNVIEFKTALKRKPTIKSVKITKAKYHKKYTRGYWSLAGNWTPGHWSYYTSIKVTVTLKKKVKGSVGTVFNVGGASYRVSGNKTKYTFNASVSGNAVGKNTIVKACSYNNKQGIGMGPYSKGKKAKINK